MESLEGQPAGELEGAGVRAGEVQRAECRAVDVDPNLVVRGVIAKGGVIGHILAIDTKDELHTIVEVKRATNI